MLPTWHVSSKERLLTLSNNATVQHGILYSRLNSFFPSTRHLSNIKIKILILPFNILCKNKYLTNGMSLVKNNARELNFPLHNSWDIKKNVLNISETRTIKNMNSYNLLSDFDWKYLNNTDYIMLNKSNNKNKYINLIHKKKFSTSNFNKKIFTQNNKYTNIAKNTFQKIRKKNFSYKDNKYKIIRAIDKNQKIALLRNKFLSRKEQLIRVQKTLKDKTSKVSKGFRAFWNKYGWIGLGVYLSIYFSCVGCFFIAANYGFLTGDQVKKWAENLHLQNHIDLSKLDRVDSLWGRLIIAWLATKVIEPLRLFIAVSITPSIAKLIKFWRRR